MNQSKQNPVVVVMGAGNATGSAVARRFASEGYTACVSRRNEEKLQPLIQSIEEAGGQARAFGADARKEEQVQAMFRTVEEEIGPIEVCVFNVGGNVKFPLEETTSRVYYKVWEMGCFAGFLTGREAVRYMKPRGRGTILFTGATASIRGASGFAAFRIKRVFANHGEFWWHRSARQLHPTPASPTPGLWRWRRLRGPARPRLR